MIVSAAMLLDMLVKGALLCLAGAALARLARGRSAALRHDIWMAAIACCALLPIAALLVRILPLWLPAAPVHRAAMALAPALPSSLPGGTVELVDRIWSGDGSLPLSGAVKAALVAIWLAGLAVAIVRIARSYRAAAAIVRRASPFASAASPRGARVLITAELTTPAVSGLAAPVILLPAEAVEWPGDRLRAVFAHEIAHIRRRDGVLELVVQLACALHWFNPLLWSAARNLRSERELACDDRVVAAGLEPRSYAAALVQVARAALGPGRTALLTMARPPELERRVRRLLGPRRRALGPCRVRAAAGWLAVALFMPAALMTAPASGLLASGSVQPGGGDLAGLDDPMSELVPLPYDDLARAAAALPATGPDAGAIAGLKAHLSRESRGYGDLVRQRAIWALSQVQAGRLVEPLAERVTDRDWRIRAYAAWGLAATGDRRATARLAPLLDDPVWRVRAMAAAALAEIGDPAAADALVAALDDPAWQVRISAVRYVGRVGNPALARHLLPLLADPHGGTRRLAEEVFARF